MIHFIYHFMVDFRISLFVQEIFNFLKYANEPNDDIINTTEFWSNMMQEEMLDSLQ